MQSDTFKSVQDIQAKQDCYKLLLIVVVESNHHNDHLRQMKREREIENCFF